MRVVQAEVSPGARERKENESMRERVSWERDGYGLEGVGGERGRQNLNINSPVNFRVGSSSGQTLWDGVRKSLDESRLVDFETRSRLVLCVVSGIRPTYEGFAPGGLL